MKNLYTCIIIIYYLYRRTKSTSIQDYDGNCLSADSLREALRRAVFFTFRRFATRPGDALDTVSISQLALSMCPYKSLLCTSIQSKRLYSLTC